jgi:hypothetical protein
MQLAGGGALLRAVGLTIDHEAAGATDAFAAVTVEHNGFATGLDEVLVDGIEHLEEGHLVLHVSCLIGLESARVVGVVLTPDLQSELHVSSPE